MKQTFANFYLVLLWTLARLQLSKNSPLVIGITGSAGKSSCTKVVADVLAPHFSLKYTKKGNSETGIPFEILNIPVTNYSALGWLWTLVLGLKSLILDWQKYEIFVAEMGIDNNRPPKDMTTLLKIVQPSIGVLLNANSVHLQYFSGPKTVQAVADEKSKMLVSLPATGLAVYNADQTEFAQLNKKISVHIKTFGVEKTADLKLDQHQVSLDGTEFSFNYGGQKHVIKIKNELVFKEAFGSFAAAILVAEHLGLKVEQVVEELSNNYKVLAGRGRVFAGINDSIIIDSSYNSSLTPTSASLRMLKEVAGRKKRTIALLGDMRELGEKAQADHEALEKVALNNADVIITVGPLTKQYFSDAVVIKFDNAYQAADYIEKIIKKDDLILVKGSQNTIFLEIVVERLLQDKSNKKLLCRRGEYWQKQRQLLNLNSNSVNLG